MATVISICAAWVLLVPDQVRTTMVAKLLGVGGG